MAFYFKPPRGSVEYQTLQKCVDERLKFIRTLSVSSLTSVGCIEYLYEDSGLDRAGHFTLRLASVRNPSFLPAFINYETKLLKFRLNSYTSRNSLSAFLKTQLRHAKECLDETLCSEKIVKYFKNIVNIFTKMSSKCYRNHVFDEAHVNGEKCGMFTLNVPFQYCSTLVTKRVVKLRSGFVQITCEKWLELLVALFCTFLRIAVSEMNYSKNVQIALEDGRIKTIIDSIWAEEDFGSYSNRILLTEIEKHSKLFPLCMQNLQNSLKRTHRLAHEERFNLSLFLKDIGISLEDSIIYWKSEYIKEHGDCSQCTHSWEKNGKKYIYSIRHMYGLEGGRKNYKVRSCTYFQGMSLKPMQEGGCPFKHFDNENLLSLISHYSIKNKRDVEKALTNRKENPTSACHQFLKALIKSLNSLESCDSSNSNISFKFTDPVQYFLILKGKV